MTDSDPDSDHRRETYSHGHAEPVLQSHRWRTAENSAGYLLPHLQPSDHLLDVGMGPGTITVDFARRLTDGWVVGIDNAQAAVAAAAQAATQAGVGRLTLDTGDAYALDFAEASFDVVHAHQLLQHLRAPVQALAELRRVCRPGGLVAVRDADYAAMTWYPADPTLDRWLELYRAVARGNCGEPDAGRRLKSWAEAAGFASVRSSASVWCFADQADLGWWSSTWADRLTGSDFGTQAVAAGLTNPAELAALASGWRKWARSPGAWFAVLHGEVLATR